MSNKGRLFILISVCAVCLLLSLGANWLAMTGILDPIFPPSYETLMNRHFYNWRTSPIANYRIEVRFDQAIWHAQRYIITVRDYQVVAQESECLEIYGMGPCQTRPYEANNYTVEGLFALVYAWYESDPANLYATFDPTYHYPQSISFDDPMIFDEQANYRVVSFELLP